MKEKDLTEDLATMAYKAEADHEVQMARADLYKIAKYAIQMHEMLKGVSEEQGLDGWVQSKITKAADYMGSVYHHMDYEQKFDEVSEDMNAIIAKQGKKKHGDTYMNKARDLAQKKGRKLTADERDKLRNQHSDNRKESIDEGYMSGYKKYHCKDCNDTMHMPTTNCPHDSHNERGSWWRDENGNGVPDVMETNYTNTLSQKLEENLAKKKTDERSLTKGEEKKKEKIVKSMKKKTGDFKDRYGKDAKAVMYATATKMAKKTESFNTLEESVGKPITEDEFERLAEKKDACYHKVKSRYKVWPSAYASGALVQCRKKGAKNWGNSKK
tara:strand:+ start:196 stop:1176 length:981 start_codon:yes stop_codon:yes gene_type:complete